MSGNFLTSKSNQSANNVQTYYDLRRVLQRKKTAEARTLIAAGIKVNSPHRRACDTILHLAIKCGDLELVQLVLSKGPHVNFKNTHGKTPLHVAVELGYEKIVELLISKGAYVNTSAKDGSTPIQAAISSFRSKIFCMLVRNGAKTNVTLNNGQTLFYTAVKSGLSSIVDCLLKNSSVNKKANNNCLRFAILSTNEKIEQLLLEHDFELDLESINDSKLFHTIITKGHVKLVSDLLMMGANINSLTFRKINSGFTLLHTACYYQKFEIVELLILHGIELNVKDNKRKMAIFYAVRNLDVEIIRLLLINEAYIKDDPDLLNIAANKQHIEIVSLLLNYGADINGHDELGRTALHSAVINQSPQSIKDTPPFNSELSVVSILLKRGADVNTRLQTGETALHMAVQNNNEITVKALLEYDAKVNVSNSKGTTPLHLAAQVKNLTIFNSLLSRNTDVRATDVHGVTALHFAAEAGDVNIIGSLLQNKPDVNAVDRFNCTPLHYAAKYGPLECVSILLDHNADVNAFDISGSTPLHLAVGSKHAEIVELLINFDANVNVPNESGDTCLHISVERDTDTRITKLLMKHCKDINCFNQDGLTPLLIAAKKNPALVECLIDYGADVHLTDLQGRNALHIAVENGQLESVVSLLAKNADVNCKDADGKTPLLIAILDGNEELTNTLLQFNADVNYTGYRNKPLLHLALTKNRKSIINDLLIYGADVNFISDAGLTALHKVMDLYLSTEIMDLLLKFGANTDYKFRDGKTPLYIATENKRADQVRVLLNYGADMSATYGGKIALLRMFKFISSDNYNSPCEDCGSSDCYCDYMGYQRNSWNRNWYDDTNSRYEQFSSHVNECSNVVAIYRQHIRKLEAAGFYIDKEVLRALKYFKKIQAKVEDDEYDEDYEISSDIEDESDSDLDDESDVEENDGSSQESRELEAMKNEKIGSSNITFFNFLTMYADMINARFYSGLEREKLIEKCDFFHHFVILPYNCIDEILSFLSNQDLRMLVDSYKSPSVAHKRKFIFIS
ncbi:hypothetical protein KQX54_008056 [Cotesia glomerata]|uniref:Uncharacterized protein n=1 Tax=Cotesia glomerata TaxID=32391 RepID=A0AAV7HI04_COTGL|nr:hypothetical protein KQX54_008056 [Cotesia glomerata]